MKQSGYADPRPNEPPMPDPLAYYLTWTSYGTWLPGDERGWVRRGKGFQLPNPILQRIAQARMTEDACMLDREQRRVVERTVADHCRIRRWELRAVNCRSNHVHVVVAADREPEEVRDQLKAWCTTKIKELERTGGAPSLALQASVGSKTRRNRRASETTLARSASEGTPPGDSNRKSVPPIRQNWWTRGGSIRLIGDEESLEAVIRYVLEAQDRKDRPR